MAVERPDMPGRARLLRQLRPTREKWDLAFRPPDLETVGAGEESVWDYPRPPIVVPSALPMKVEAKGIIIAASSRALEVKEMAGGPVPYFPPDEVRHDWLVPNGRVSQCEWKGAACSYDLVMPDAGHVRDAAWCYPDPFDDLPQGYAAIAGWFAFYPAKLECFVGDGSGGWERVRPQPGNIYGGWMSSRIKGPAKGPPGTEGW